MQIPNKCKFIFYILEKYGFECFAVGGCVRDSLMNNTPSDWDFATNALPHQILDCFCDYKTIDIGKKYGTITVISEGESYEITTYRNDGEYTDSRHPNCVTFTNAIIDDLSRRDFTINSVAYSPAKGIIDPFNGERDIKDGVLRCTGIPFNRFSEDALRILRALRFASRFDFEIEKETSQAILNCAETLKSVHPNRLRKELIGLLMGKNPKSILLRYRDVISHIIPEIKPMFDLNQNNPHHKYDVWTHTVEALSYTECDETVRIAMFFHDIGKPSVKSTDEMGVDHFKKHQLESVNIAESIMRRFAFPSSQINDVKLLIQYHDERFHSIDKDIKSVLCVLGNNLFTKLMSVSYGDIMAQSEYKREEKLVHREKVITRWKEIILNNECYSLEQLAIKGSDLLDLGYSGKDIGTILDGLLKMVIKGIVPNEKNALLNGVKSIIL